MQVVTIGRDIGSLSVSFLTTSFESNYLQKIFTKINIKNYCMSCILKNYFMGILRVLGGHLTTQFFTVPRLTSELMSDSTRQEKRGFMLVGLALEGRGA